MPKVILAILFSIFNIDGLMLRYAPFRTHVTPAQCRRLLVSYGVLMIVNSVFMGFVFHIAGVSMAIMKADYFLFPLAATLVNILVVPGRTREHFFTYGIVAVCNFMLSAIPTYLISAIYGIDSIISFYWLLILQMLLQLSCFWFIRKLLKNTVEPFLHLESGNYWSTIWFIPIAMLLAVLVLFPGNVHVSSVNQLISRAFIGIATILMCYSIAADHQRMRDQQSMTEQLMDQRLHYAQLQTKVEDARRQSHDFKHHITAIQHFADQEDLEGLRQYCHSLSARTSAEDQVPYTGNPAADGVIYRYMQLSGENKIHFSYTGVIRSRGIADVDLCVLLGNALDNALNGCMSIPDNRRIVLAAQTEGLILSLMVRNTFDGVVHQNDDTILSRRRENSPGVGLTSMRSICDRYGGQMQVSWDDSTFTVLFLLPLEQE